MTRNRLIFCIILLCIMTGTACYSEEGFLFIDFPKVKGKYREVTAVMKKGESEITTIGMLNADGYVTEVKAKAGSGFITLRKYTLIPSGRMKELLAFYKDRIYLKEVHSFDKKNRLSEIRYFDTFSSMDLALSNIITYTYEGDSMKASFRKTDAAGKRILVRGTIEFDQAGRVIKKTDEILDNKTKEWKVSNTMSEAFDSQGYSIEYHFSTIGMKTDIWCVITFSKSTGLPVKFTDYTNREKTKPAGSTIEFTYK